MTFALRNVPLQSGGGRGVGFLFAITEHDRTFLKSIRDHKLCPPPLCKGKQTGISIQQNTSCQHKSLFEESIYCNENK